MLYIFLLKVFDSCLLLRCCHNIQIVVKVINKRTLFVYNDRRLMQKAFYTESGFIFIVFSFVRLFLYESNRQAKTFVLFRCGNTLVMGH